MPHGVIDWKWIFCLRLGGPIRQNDGGDGLVVVGVVVVVVVVVVVGCLHQVCLVGFAWLVPTVC